MLVSRFFILLHRSVDLSWYGQHVVLINTVLEVLTSDRASPSHFLLQECLGYFYPLYSGMNFRRSLPSSSRKPTRILNEIQKFQVYEFINHLEEYFIFKLLNLLIQMHDIFPLYLIIFIVCSFLKGCLMHISQDLFLNICFYLPF